MSFCELHVCNQLQLQRDPTLSAGLATLRDPWSRVSRRLERCITAPAAPTTSHAQPVAVIDQLANQATGLLITHHRPRRHAHHTIFAALTMAPFSHTSLPARCFEVHLGLERVQALIALQVNRASAPAISTARAHLRLVFLAAKGDTAVATTPGGDTYAGTVEEEPVVVRRPAKDIHLLVLVLIYAQNILLRYHTSEARRGRDGHGRSSDAPRQGRLLPSTTRDAQAAEPHEDGMAHAPHDDNFAHTDLRPTSRYHGRSGC